MAPRRSQLRWDKPPSHMGKTLQQRVAAYLVALRGLAQASAARAEAIMKAGAPWNDITAYARGALFGRSVGYNIELGTVNDEYGLFLELGTVNMAPRPIIGPTLNRTADQYFRDAITLARGILLG